MTTDLARMMERFAVPGRIEAIWLRPTRRDPVAAATEAMLTDAGLAGDHARPGKRALTLIQAEHLPVIAALAGLGRVLDGSELRRNLVVSGLNLAAMRGRSLRIGAATVTITGPCHPCSRMEEILGHGGYTAMRGHGGVTAQVVTPGRIAQGDSVVPLD